MTAVLLSLVVATLAIVVAVQAVRLRRSRVDLRRSESANAALRLATPDLVFVLSKDGCYLDFHARDRSELTIDPTCTKHGWCRSTTTRS